ncbi:hypothetical protein Slin15195_G085850 [Septoria linicola]|uniref:Uncharacterized protein n=1 Tax=Septoria linicola TaxID=215465 RepID=A0A9Q9B0W8_9PEZI|nr:hypothetical protein Slin14017_G088440 [Septoria linicola]USW55266.1 hypothetical protein Slin15195_G085850 [Septoria linicola]
MDDMASATPVCDNGYSRLIDFTNTITIEMDSVKFHVPAALIKARSRRIAHEMSKAYGADTATGHITQAGLDISYAASAFSMYLQLLY